MSDDARVAGPRPAPGHRVLPGLADLLLVEGDPRGELMQLQLDAEAGPLKGLVHPRAAPRGESSARA